MRIRAQRRQNRIFVGVDSVAGSLLFCDGLFEVLSVVFFGLAGVHGVDTLRLMVSIPKSMEGDFGASSFFSVGVYPVI